MSARRTRAPAWETSAATSDVVGIASRADRGMERHYGVPGAVRRRRQEGNPMFWRRIAVALIVLLTAMVSFAGSANSAQASPHGPLLPAPKEGPKVILSET